MTGNTQNREGSTMSTTAWSPAAWLSVTLMLLAPAACGTDLIGVPETPGPSTALLRAPREGPPAGADASLMIVSGLTVDAAGNPVLPGAVDPTTPLYYARTRAPILAPDGHQVTAGEFAAPRGSASVRCVPSGTLVDLHVRGLIPNATYRVWLLTFKAPGFSIGPPPDFSNLIGEGALGPSDRSRNTFRASASGEGQITRIHPAGTLSETLPAPPFANDPAGSCLLTDEFEWHVVAAFQQPGQPQGTDIGPPALFPGTAVEQFTFIFRGP